MRSRNHRHGFTLVELIVVIAILLVLTLMAVGVYRANAGGDKMRSAARIAQSAFLGARDRALHAKTQRGLRLIRDPQSPKLVIGFAYLQPIDSVTYPLNSIRLERPDWNGNNVYGDPGEEVTIVNGKVAPAAPAVDWVNLTDFFPSQPRIRIPSGPTGRWYSFIWTTAAPYPLNATNAYLQLTTPFVDPGSAGQIAWDYASSNSSCDIEMSPELLPNQAPIALPSGVVIDLTYCSTQLSSLSDTTYINFMFSPRGTVAGAASALGPIHMLLRDVQDAVQGINPLDLNVQHREELILTVFPQTGHIASFPVSQTDAVNNSTGVAGADGLIDDIFAFAKIGSTAAN